MLRIYLRTNLRGRTRITDFLAHKFRSLQAVPVILKDQPSVFVDLRIDLGPFLLSGSPWTCAPFEIDEQNVMRQVVRAGEIAYDIGANLGLHTALLSQAVGPTGRVCAFEPNRQLIPPLTQTVASLGNATLFPFALSDRQGESILFIPNNHVMGSLADYTGDAQLAEWRKQIGLTKAEPVKCELSSIDYLIANKAVPPPDFIKCDVEGAELNVFRGGQIALDRIDAPIILFEAREECARGFGLEKTSAIEFLRSLHRPHYQFFEVNEGGVLQLLNAEDFTAPNILAVPQSKRDRVKKLEAI